MSIIKFRVKEDALQQDSPSTTRTPVGNTFVASTNDNPTCVNLTTHGSGPLVLSVTTFACNNLTSQEVIFPLVKSLAWPLVCKRVTFEAKELNRFKKSLRQTALNIHKHISEDNLEQTFIKYWLDKFMCQIMGDDVMPKRHPLISCGLFTGWIKRCIARSIARRDISLIYSLQKGSKQMWPKLSPSKYLEAMKDSMKNIGTPRGFLHKQYVETLYHTSLEVFRKLKPPMRFMPSSSACLQATRREGGALSIYEHLKPVKKEVIGSLKTINLSLDIWRQETWSTSLSKIASDINKLDSTDTYFPSLDVRWIGLYEPAKIRPIGYMDGHLCTALRPLQGQLLNAWKSTKWTTMNDSCLLERVRVLDEQVKEEFWCSGDYKNATDLLLRDVSLTALSAIKGHQLYSLAHRSMSSGRLLYPDGPDPKDPYANGTYVDQYEGQLMGHPLSFPFLCVINLAVYRSALRKWRWAYGCDEDRYDRLYNNVIINGDDILFKGPAELIDTFKSVSADFGFQISIGKNYQSRDSCQINSQVFIRRNGLMERRGYLNLRLIEGTNIKEGESQALPTQIGTSLNDMIKLTPWTASAVPYAMKRFAIKDRRKHWFEPNWYIPVHLGGYGLSMSYCPSDHKITRDQRRVAAMFIADPDLALYRMTSGTRKRVLPKGFISSKITFGDYVPDAGEVLYVDADSNDWISRQCTYLRALEGHKDEESDQMKLQRIVKTKRLKPISLDNLKYYLDSRVWVSNRVPCPPLTPIMYGISQKKYHKHYLTSEFLESFYV